MASQRTIRYNPHEHTISYSGTVILVQITGMTDRLYRHFMYISIPGPEINRETLCDIISPELPRLLAFSAAHLQCNVPVCMTLAELHVFLDDALKDNSNWKIDFHEHFYFDSGVMDCNLNEFHIISLYPVLAPIINATLALTPLESSILFQDSDVCVLHPQANEGIVIYHSFDKRLTDSINTTGLQIGYGRENGIRSIRHDYIFFRAPGNNTITVPSSPTHDDVSQNYHVAMFDDPADTRHGFFCIRIDPLKTFVYSSEARAHGLNWQDSRKSIQDFRRQIEENNSHTGYSRFYDLITFRRLQHQTANISVTKYPPERHGEILVRHNIPPSWRVLIT